MNHLLLFSGAALLLSFAPSSSPAGEQDLTLETLRGEVLERSRKIQVRKLEARVAQHRVSAEHGIFEPVLTASSTFTDGERPNSTEQQESQGSSPVYVNRDLINNVGVMGLLPLGTQYKFGASINRLQNNQDGLSTSALGQFAPPATTNLGEEEYVTFVGVELTQPLLRDFGIDITQSPIRAALLEADIREYELRQETSDLLAQAENAYWDLKHAYEQRRFRQQSTRIARDLLRDMKNRLEAGKVSQIEVYQAETGLMLRETQEREAEQNYREAVSTLQVAVSRGAGEGFAELPVPVAPVDAEPRDFSFDTSLSRAVTHYPSYVIAKKEQERADLDLVLADNATRPRLDLVASYGHNGWAHTIGRSLEHIGGGTFDTWSVGVQFEMPLDGNRRARHELIAANLKVEQRGLAAADLRVELANTLEMVLGRIESLKRRLMSLGKVVQFNERLLETATQRLQGGKGTSRQVLDVEEDLFEARNNELKAKIDIRKTLIQLEAVEGTLLQNRGIDVIKLYLK